MWQEILEIIILLYVGKALHGNECAKKHDKWYLYVCTRNCLHMFINQRLQSSRLHYPRSGDSQPDHLARSGPHKS